MTRPPDWRRLPPTPPEHRVTISSPALRACFRAHQHHEHPDEHATGCRTCIRYTAALILATTREQRARGDQP